jgi:hypothetical protein
MAAGFYTHYFTALCVLVHWAWLGLLSASQPSARRLITRPAWWLANVGIVLVYLPWLPNLVGLVQHVEQLKVGGDIGWEAPVNLFSVPSMIWQFMLQDEGLGLRPVLFWSFPLLLVAVVGVCAWHDKGRYRPAGLLALFFLLPLLLVYGFRLSRRCLSSVTSPSMPWLCRSSWRWPSTVCPGALHGWARHCSCCAGWNCWGEEQRDRGWMTNSTCRWSSSIATTRKVTASSSATCCGTSATCITTAPTPNCSFTPRPSLMAHRRGRTPMGLAPWWIRTAVYLDRLSALPATTQRVWLISSNEAPDDFAPLPDGWRQIMQQDGGGARRDYSCYASAQSHRNQRVSLISIRNEWNIKTVAIDH